MPETTVGLDRLGDEIAVLAAQIQAATCRWLGLVAEFDEREGWAAWGCRSCAHWISWRCSIAPGAAREHVRVARRLRELALVRAAFARGELSYSKVRALTRVHDVAREADLLELGRSSTAAQLERIVRGYRRVLAIDAARAYEERFLSVIHDDDGSVLIKGRLAGDDGALLVKALEAFRATGASVSAGTPAGEDVSAGTPAGENVSAEMSGERVSAGTRNADALVALADAALTAASTDRTGGDRYQVVVHVDADTLAADRPGGRVELDDHAPLAAETARRICCDASIVALTHRDGKPLSVGRKTRSIPPALRRALRTRDAGCRFPGCTQRRGVDAHHITHWVHGGPTALSNLVELCRHHHRLVHEHGYHVQRTRSGTLVFRRPDGRHIASAPRSPRGDHHDPAAITRHLTPDPDACTPRWYGEPLNLADAVEAVLATTTPHQPDG